MDENKVYLDFLSEVYYKIKDNYWDNLTDTQLVNLFKAAAEQLTNSQYNILASGQPGLRATYNQIMKGYSNEQKKEFTVKLVNLVINSLLPVGRNALYTQHQQEQLKNEVQNVNPGNDLYQSLGANKASSSQELKQSYDEKVTKLKKQDTAEAKKELVRVNYAYNVLSDNKKKSNYDTYQAEPTVFTKLVSPNILYLYIKRFSPTTLDELIEATKKVDQGETLDTLILDLRGNIGGVIDLLPFLLGPFIGPDQYAYEFLHQGEKLPFKTKVGWAPSLVRYKRVVILVDSMTQSTGEVMAATFKKYNVGILMGTKTRGWGTVEKIIPLTKQVSPNETYSLLMVEDLTLRDDSEPIEGKGVEPVISLTDPKWKQQLYQYYHDDKLASAIEEIWSSPVPSQN